MIMKAHSYLRTKLIYLNDNELQDFEFRGVKVINTAREKRDERKSKG
jgi:hypothetical protein